MTKGCIYYTDNRTRWFILQKCQEEILKGWKGKLISVSLKPIKFGENLVLAGRTRSYPTMLTQIVMALETLDTDVVFFLEHDVLYHPSHFDFWPEKEDVYYYNINNYRWGIWDDMAFTNNGQHSLSQLCCWRETALKHFKARLDYVTKEGWDINRAREPRLAQIISYEPGTKPKSRGGITNETFEIWRSELPNIDIRHRHNFSSPKFHSRDFPVRPPGWKETKLEDIPYWNLQDLKNLWWSKYERELTSW